MPVMVKNKQRSQPMRLVSAGIMMAPTTMPMEQVPSMIENNTGPPCSSCLMKGVMRFGATINCANIKVDNTDSHNSRRLLLRVCSTALLID